MVLEHRNICYKKSEFYKESNFREIFIPSQNDPTKYFLNQSYPQTKKLYKSNLYISMFYLHEKVRLTVEFIFRTVYLLVQIVTYFKLERKATYLS